jgi:hypothetical protein
VDWIVLGQDRNRWRAVVNSALNLRVPWNAGKLSSGLSSTAQLHRASWLTPISSHYSVSIFAVRVLECHEETPTPGGTTVHPFIWGYKFLDLIHEVWGWTQSWSWAEK